MLLNSRSHNIMRIMIAIFVALLLGFANIGFAADKGNDTKKNETVSRYIKQDNNTRDTVVRGSNTTTSTTTIAKPVDNGLRNQDRNSKIESGARENNRNIGNRNVELRPESQTQRTNETVNIPRESRSSNNSPQISDRNTRTETGNREVYRSIGNKNVELKPQNQTQRTNNTVNIPRESRSSNNSPQVSDRNTRTETGNREVYRSIGNKNVELRPQSQTQRSNNSVNVPNQNRSSRDTVLRDGRDSNNRQNERSVGPQTPDSRRQPQTGIRNDSRGSDNNRPRLDRDTTRNDQERQRPVVNRDNSDKKRDSVYKRPDVSPKRDINNRDYRDNRDRHVIDKPRVLPNDRNYRGNQQHRDTINIGARDAGLRVKLPFLKNGYFHYESRPTHKYRYGHWDFKDYGRDYSRRSLYYHYGCLPYVNRTRISILPYISISFYNRTIPYNNYYLRDSSYVGLNDTMTDIRNAWVNGRADLITNYVRSDEQIAILLDGKYDYSLNADDYAQMTEDAINDIQTISFTWDTVKQKKNNEFVAYARHTFRDASDEVQTVYVSYTFHKSGRSYYITEAGSSATRQY